MLELYYWNPFPLTATAPYRPLQIGAVPAGCPDRPLWWLAAAAAAGLAAGYAYQKNKAKAPRRR